MPDRIPLVDPVSKNKVYGFHAAVIAGKDVGSWDIVRPKEILYVFLARAAGLESNPRSQRIHAKWIRLIAFRPEVAYIRTADGLYASHVRSLATFRELSPVDLWAANQSVLINPGALGGMDAEERVKQIRFIVPPTPWSWERETIPLGKTFAPGILARFAAGRGFI